MPFRNIMEQKRSRKTSKNLKAENELLRSSLKAYKIMAQERLMPAVEIEMLIAELENFVREWGKKTTTHTQMLNQLRNIIDEYKEGGER